MDLKYHHRKKADHIFAYFPPYMDQHAHSQDHLHNHNMVDNHQQGGQFPDPTDMVLVVLLVALVVLLVLLLSLLYLEWVGVQHLQFPCTYKNLFRSRVQWSIRS
jgi:hypothetical protein